MVSDMRCELRMPTASEGKIPLGQDRQVLDIGRRIVVRVHSVVWIIRQAEFIAQIEQQMLPGRRKSRIESRWSSRPERK